MSSPASPNPTTTTTRCNKDQSRSHIDSKCLPGMIYEVIAISLLYFLSLTKTPRGNDHIYRTPVLLKHLPVDNVALIFYIMLKVKISIFQKFKVVCTNSFVRNKRKKFALKNDGIMYRYTNTQ